MTREEENIVLQQLRMTDMDMIISSSLLNALIVLFVYRTESFVCFRILFFRVRH